MCPEPRIIPHYHQLSTTYKVVKYLKGKEMCKVLVKPEMEGFAGLKMHHFPKKQKLNDSSSVLGVLAEIRLWFVSLLLWNSGW